MTKAQRDAITMPPAVPATGLLIYQTNSTPGFYYYSGTVWMAVTPKANGWSLTGNSGTTPATDFIGTTDAQPLVFKVNNQKAGYLDYSNDNTGFGFQTLIKAIGGANTANGYKALYTNKGGYNNTANGAYVLYSNSEGHNNTANGYRTLFTNTTGYYNAATGAFSLENNIGGIGNTGNGISSLRNITKGSNNTATGANTLFANTTGYSNVAVGTNSLFNNISGSNLVAVGDSALYNQKGGSNNTAVGSKALYSNTTGGANTANGYNALYTNKGGFNNTANGAFVLYSNSVGHNNTANGYRALFTNTTGYYNAATGAFSLENNIGGIGNTGNGISALRNNTNGNDNTATGANTLFNNTTGYSNVAVGSNALFKNTTSSNNVAVGDSALYNQNGGIGYGQNTAVGSKALFSNTTGIGNSAFGEGTLLNNLDGNANTAIGSEALNYNVSGNSNTAIGSGALYGNRSSNNLTAIGGNAGTVDDGYSYSYSSALGYNSLITASNQVRIGDASTLSIGGYQSWTTLPSDKRVKKNIKENVPGLAFINKLKPVTYNLDLNAIDKIVQRPVIKDKDGKTIQPSQQELDSRKAKEQILFTGFVAQDVEAAASSINYDFSGIDMPKNDKDIYGLRYSDFVVPLVKAVQELSKANDDKDAKINDLQKQNGDLETRVAKLEAMMNVHQSTTNLSSVFLDQNVPNPFSNTTTISYSLPKQYSSAKIIVIDESGKTIKIFNLSGTGKGTLNFSSPFRVGASYQYSLLVDGKLIDTKQMVLTK